MQLKKNPHPSSPLLAPPAAAAGDFSTTPTGSSGSGSIHLLDDPDALDELAPTRQQVVPETLQEERERIGDQGTLALGVPLPHGAAPRLDVSNLSFIFVRFFFLIIRYV